MRFRKGFTLIESLIVIFIIVVATAIAIPQFQKMAINGNLKASAGDMVGDFTNMRERAIAENQNYQIVFNQSLNNYNIPGQANPKSPASFDGKIIITGLSFGTTLTFQTRGTTFPPGDKTITLTNGLGSTATITVGTAGRIYVSYILR